MNKNDFLDSDLDSWWRTVPATATDSDSRKPWENRYEHKFQKPSSRKSAGVPTVQSLPQGRYVILQSDRLGEDFVSIEESIIPWIVEMKIKLRQQLFVLCEDGEVRAAFIFKSKSATLLFKLAWG